MSREQGRAKLREARALLADGFVRAADSRIREAIPLGLSPMDVATFFTPDELGKLRDAWVDAANVVKRRSWGAALGLSHDRRKPWETKTDGS